MGKCTIKFFAVLSMLVFALGSAGCGGTSSASPDSVSDSVGNGSDSGSSEAPPKQTVACLADTELADGFSLRGLDSVTDSGVVKVVDYGTGLTPKWGVAQWWSKYNLKDGEETLTEDRYSLKDESKTVEINRKHGSVTLGVDASKEFDTYNVVAPAKWPHLLLEQGIDAVPLADAESVAASLDFTLTVNDDLRGGAGLQAQFAWFIYVVDTNPQSEGYGNFLWFGLNIFDSTKLYAPKSCMQDTAGGPGNFIYALSAAEYLPKRVKVNENIAFEVDILPYIREGIATAQSAGFMRGTSVEDCSLTGMNIGWEIFDRWNESITLFDIDIVKTLKGE